MSANISNASNAYITQVPALNEVADIQQALSYYHFGSALPTDYANVVAVSHANTNATSGSLVGYLKGLQVQIDDRANMASPNLTGNVTITGNTSATGNISGNILISTVADGTAPFSVVSTTTVANLTADKVGHSQTIKVDSGSTEGTTMYTFNGSSDKAINLQSGNNITINGTANTITINSVEGDSFANAKTFTSNVTMSSNAFIGNVLAQKVIDAGTSYNVNSNSYTLDLASGQYFSNITVQKAIGTWSFVNSTNITAVTTSGTTNIAVAFPSGYQDGDLAVIYAFSYGADISVNAAATGWTTVYNNSNDSVIAYKQITNSDTSVDIRSTSGNKRVGAVLNIYRNSVSSPYSPSIVLTSASATSGLTPPSITTIGQNSLVIVAGGVADQDGTITSAPTGYSNLNTVTAYGNQSSNSAVVTIANKIVSTPGIETPSAFTVTNFANFNFLYTLEFKGYTDPAISFTNKSLLSNTAYKGLSYKLSVNTVSNVNTVTTTPLWDSSVKWKSATANVLSNTAGYLENLVTLTSFDGGTTFMGSL